MRTVMGAPASDGLAPGRGGEVVVDVDTLFRDRWVPSLRLATMLVGDRAVAEEIVQDALLEVTRRWDHIDNPAGYLRVAVVNGSRSHLRWIERGRRRRLQPSPLVTDEPELDELWALLATLSPRRRAALVLRYYEDLGIDEIARLLDCRPGTVSSLLHRGLADLRKVLSHDV